VNVADDLKMLLADNLQLGARAQRFTRDSVLLGELPELDSQGAMQVLTAIEEHFGFSIANDEQIGEVFATFGTLVDFVASRCA
jgi:acyl carrier protein